MRTNGIRNLYAVIFFPIVIWLLDGIIAAAESDISSFLHKISLQPWVKYYMYIYVFAKRFVFRFSNIAALIVLKLNLLLFMKTLKISRLFESKINFLKILGKHEQITD